jgi:hypothetical protein
MSDFFTFDIPAGVTVEGVLVIKIKRVADVTRRDRISMEQCINSGGWGTPASEEWLLKNRLNNR